MSEYRVRLSLLVFNESRTNHLRGTFETTLPFAPSVGTNVEFADMYPLEFKTVTWLADESLFHCTVEDNLCHSFDLDSSVAKLSEEIDTLRDAKRLGWDGLDRIYRDE